MPDSGSSFLIFLLAILIFVGWIFTKVDRRMQQFLDIQVILDTGLLGWASKLEFAERIVYWIAGFKVFLLYPVFGVGLGNSGFFIPQNLSSFGYSLPEVLRIFLSNTFLPNPKNLWVRILAETGIVGFSVFISWLWVGWKTARTNERSSIPTGAGDGDHRAGGHRRIDRRGLQPGHFCPALLLDDIGVGCRRLSDFQPQ